YLPRETLIDRRRHDPRLRRPSGALYCGPSMPAVIDVCEREIERARRGGEPVVYLTDDHLPDDAEFKMFPPHAIHGTKGAEVIPALAPAAGDVVIPKRRYSGFFGTDLDITLRERAIDTLRTACASASIWAERSRPSGIFIASNARGSVSLMPAVYVFARSRVRPNRPAACTASSTTRSMTPFAAGSQIATRAARRARTGSAPATRRTSARAASASPPRRSSRGSVGRYGA